MKRISGIWPVIPTPIETDGKIDEEGLRRVIRRSLTASIGGLWILGAGSEFTNLSREQRQLIMKVTREEVAGRVPILAGVGSCDLNTAIRDTRIAEEEGMDGVHSLEPYFYKLRASELVEYFERLADESPLPLVIYHHPSRWSGPPHVLGKVPPELIRLARHSQIIGMKQSTIDFRDFQRLVFELRSDTFSILTSAGRLLLASLVIGADGGVFHEAVVAPHQFVSLYESVKSGDISKAVELQAQLAPLGDIMSIVDHAAAKVALEELGLCDCRMIPPHKSMEPVERTALLAILEDLKLTRHCEQKAGEIGRNV